jgi:hypothetical protein
VIVDFHTHVGDFRRAIDTELQPVTWQSLIARLDEEGIDKAVLLPVYPSPENYIGPGFLTGGGMDVREQVLEAGRHGGRIIPFGNLDPRWMGNRPDADFGPLLDWFRAQGCRGIGEVTANLPFDDARVVNMFRQAGERGLPVLFHGIGFGAGQYGLQDEPGAPRLERLLQAAPRSAIVGHGQGFWAEIAAGLSAAEKLTYPQGPVAEEGALPRLLRAYPNLYADISAGSGHNALTRDPAYGPRFLEEFQDRILFGTDVCSGDAGGRMPHLALLQRLLAEGKLSPVAFGKITWGNAARLLGGL